MVSGTCCPALLLFLDSRVRVGLQPQKTDVLWNIGVNFHVLVEKRKGPEGALSCLKGTILGQCGLISGL